jgi:hypothetical protein
MKVFLIILLIFVGSSIRAQANIDSIVIHYLQSQQNTPAPFLQVTKQGRETIRTANFIEPNEPVIKDTIKISTFLFGSSASHSSKYFLIQVFVSNKFLYKIIDRPSLKEGIQSPFTFIEPYDLPDANKAVLINQLSYKYY